jgi:hypothetical protein
MISLLVKVGTRDQFLFSYFEKCHGFFGVGGFFSFLLARTVKLLLCVQKGKKKSAMVEAEFSDIQILFQKRI